MKIKVFSHVVYVLVALFFAVAGLETWGMLTRGRTFVYELAQMPREQAYVVVRSIVLREMGALGLEAFEYYDLGRLDLVLEEEIDKYLDTYSGYTTLDRVYLNYLNEYVPVRKEISVPLAVALIASLTTLELVQGYRLDRQETGAVPEVKYGKD